jgi:hypothetical protein
MQNYFCKRIVGNEYAVTVRCALGEVTETSKLITLEEQNVVKTLKFEPLLQIQLDIVVQPAS